jgi:excisionase family DNA binding protein
MHLDGYLKVNEVAAELEVSYASALSYIRKGHLKAIRAGGRWKVKDTEVQRFKREGNLKKVEE